MWLRDNLNSEFGYIANMVGYPNLFAYKQVIYEIPNPVLRKPKNLVKYLRSNKYIKRKEVNYDKKPNTGTRKTDTKL